MTNLDESWKKILDLLEKEVTAVSFDLFIKTLEPIEINNNCLVLAASSENSKTRCLSLHATPIKIAVTQVFDNVNSFEILSPAEKEEYLKQTKPENETVISEDFKENLQPKFNPKYTFDTFVVGSSNRIVYAAARSVAENPCSNFNPLFIYGGVGLGKTHLMHAIGNHLKQTKPNLNVLYVTCEKFTNDYISSLSGKDKGVISFREKYRNLDVFMVDDIQFISGKKETQEEFFHTFNDLYQNNKQIIIASDRPPKEISTLSDRLTSRFTSGLIQDIQQPDFETKVAILKKKALQENYNVEDEVITYLAENINTNVRELEGSLSKVCFYANLLGKKFANLHDAKEALKDTVKEEKENLSPDIILENICKYYNVTKNDILGKKKNKEIVDPRQMCIYLITEMLDLPLASIGTYMGGRDHTTIIHARDKIALNLKSNNKLKVELADLKQMILKH